MKNKVIIFDTTLRDGELMTGVDWSIEQKRELAQVLELAGVDIIEVGYPGAIKKDFEAVFQVAQVVKNSTVCVLASDKSEEITLAGEAIQPAIQGRIHVYTPVNLRTQAMGNEEKTLSRIRASITQARNYCTEVEWSAFDATRSEPTFLYQAVETAIASGATTVNIPDSLGTESPESFAQLLELLQHRVDNLHKITLSVHCHDDLGLAVENSITALHHGARQIECSLNGLGARKGNADLAEIVQQIAQMPDYQTDVNLTQLNSTSELINKLTC